MPFPICKSLREKFYSSMDREITEIQKEFGSRIVSKENC